jgi:hypothetical protein
MKELNAFEVELVCGGTWQDNEIANPYGQWNDFYTGSPAPIGCTPFCGSGPAGGGAWDGSSIP